VYQRRRLHRLENAVIGALVRTGLVPRSYILTTVGRKSGQERRNPVTIVQREGRRWLVAPYGAVPWVLNARAAGRVALTRRWTTRHYLVREVSADEAGPVLKDYVRMASATRPYFAASRHDPPEAFAREAGAHSVFELLPLEDQPGPP